MGSAEARGATSAARRALGLVADRADDAARGAAGARRTETRIAEMTRERASRFLVTPNVSFTCGKYRATFLTPPRNVVYTPRLRHSPPRPEARQGMMPPGSVTVTRVRRCAEEAKGGLELAWSFGVASAFQRLCEESASTSGSSRFDAEVVGHTTPAVADVGRGSLRVRFLRSHKRDGIVGDQATFGRDDNSGRERFPTGGLLLGVRRTTPSSCREEPRSTTFATVSADRATRQGEPSAYRFLPAIAAAPGARGPDRHGNSRDGLAELVVMARPLATEQTLSRRDDVAEIEKVSEGKRFQKKPRDANRIDARDESFVTSLDDASLRSWLPVGAKADIVVLRRVTGFHLGLNANRWLKIRMREIADGVAGLAFLDRDEKTAEKTNVSASPASFYRGTGLVLDPSGVINDAPVGASYEFEHWGAGGNTGVSGQVTVW